MPSPIHVTIPEPCHENWQQMTPNEQGRHCMSCQKTVVDFTLMSDQEILDYISRASTSVCGRFNNHQLDKTYAERKIKPSFTFRYAWNMIVAAFLLTGSAATAQTKKKAKKRAVNKSEWKLKYKDIKVAATEAILTLAPEQIEQLTTLGYVASTSEQVQELLTVPRLKIFGLIRDSKTGKPINAASVRIKGLKRGIDAGKDGRFEFPIVDLSGQIMLEMSADGYVTQDYTVPVYSFRSMEFYLDRDPAVQPVEDDYDTMLGKVAVQQPESVIVGALAIVKLDTVELVEPGVAEIDAIKCGTVKEVEQDTADIAEDTISYPMIVIPPVNNEKDDPGLPANIDTTVMVLEDFGKYVAGGISVTEKVTPIEKIKREINEWLPTKKDVRIYPNPVVPGNQVNVNLSLGKTGVYKLELMDASGRLVYVQALQVMQQSQVVNVPTQASWSRGVYWVRISSANVKNVYQAKVMLQ